MPKRIKRGKKIDTLTKMYIHWVKWGYCTNSERAKFLFYFNKINKKWIYIVVRLTEDLRDSKAQVIKYRKLYKFYLGEVQKLSKVV